MESDVYTNATFKAKIDEWDKLKLSDQPQEVTLSGTMTIHGVSNTVSEKGVILQKYKDGKLADAKTFEYADGLSWHQKGGRQRTETELLAWKGKRASAGRMPPTGFPKPPKFT